jgi:hypothetical protein
VTGHDVPSWLCCAPTLNIPASVLTHADELID